MNLPWLHYGHDFGSAWGHQGVSHPLSKSTIEDALSKAKEAGATFVRWFLFGDGRALGKTSNEHFDFDLILADVQCALELAKQSDLQVIFVLFDYQWFKDAHVHRGVQMFGRASWLSPSERARTFERFVGPLLSHIQDHPNLWLIELMNEPEWLLEENALVRNPLKSSELIGLLGELKDFVRTHAPTLQITLGCAHSRWLSMWDFLDVDVRQVHHYEGNLPKGEGILLGEFSSTGGSVREMLRASSSLGYSGAAPWSLLSEDAHSDADVLLRALSSWSSRSKFS